MKQDEELFYQQISPGGFLASYVDSFWMLKAPAPLVPQRERRPANGCVDVVFHFAGACKHAPAGRQEEMPAFQGSVLLGPRSQGYVIEPTGDTYCVTIRFRPGGLAAFIPFQLYELADQTVDLELIWGNDVREWEERLFDAPTLEQSGDILMRILQSRLAERPNQRAVQAAVRRIDALGGNISMHALADELGWSEKHLERIFAQSVGFPPKHYSRIARFRRLSHFVAHPHPNRTMGRLAADFGYYDQSHLTREVTTLAGAPPREFFSLWCPTCGGAPLHLQGCPNQQR